MSAPTTPAAAPVNSSPYLFSSLVPPARPARPTAKAYTVRYRLRNGASGLLPVIAATSCDAVAHALDHFGEQIRSLSVKLAEPALPSDVRPA